MILAMLGWTKLPQWAIELVALALVAFGVWFSYHHVAAVAREQEIATIRAADEKAAAILQQRVDDAEHKHDDELAQLARLQSSAPITSVRLCNNAAPVLPDEATLPPLNDGTSASAVGVQPVPPGDSSVRPGNAGRDIGAMLSALAASADEVSAALRVYQNASQ